MGGLFKSGRAIALFCDDKGALARARCRDHGCAYERGHDEVRKIGDRFHQHGSTIKRFCPEIARKLSGLCGYPSAFELGEILVKLERVRVGERFPVLDRAAMDDVAHR